MINYLTPSVILLSTSDFLQSIEAFEDIIWCKSYYGKVEKTGLLGKDIFRTRKMFQFIPKRLLNLAQIIIKMFKIPVS